MSKLAIGDKAPGFTLPRTPEENVSLHETLKKGPVVLVFFPAAFSPACSEELRSFRNKTAQIEELGATILGISTDGIFTLMSFSDMLDFQFPLLSDWNKEVIRDYDVVHPNLAGMREIAQRAVFILEPDARIHYKWVSEDPLKQPPMDEILDQVQVRTSPEIVS